MKVEESKEDWFRYRKNEPLDLIRYELFGEKFNLEISEALFRKVMDYCGYIEGVEWEMVKIVKGGGQRQ